ncbi:MAG: DnaJ domain-containing protein [Persicimonas sp.]
MIDDNVAPTPREGVDFSSVSPSPTPEQYFLLSRLDGKLTVAELCKISGLGRKKTLEALEVLARAGAIEVPGVQIQAEEATGLGKTARAGAADGAAAGSPQPSGGRASSASPAQSDQKKDNTNKKAKRSKRPVVPNYPVPIDEFDFDDQLLCLDVDLDEQRRREVICLHEQLGQMTHYDIFGLAPDADRKEIKKAYFRMSKRYHPDKFFRKDVDVFGPMVETIFKEITKAYRTLSNKRKRDEYDAEVAQHPVVESSVDRSPNSAAEADAEPAEQPGDHNRRKAAAVLLKRRAEKLRDREQFKDAAVEYRKALALNRDGGLALRVAGMLLDRAQMAEEAGSFARAAIKLGAPPSSAHFLLGRVYETIGSTQAAIEHYRKVVADAPDHAKAKARLDELSH